MDTWRLIPDRKFSAGFNMAADGYLLRQAEEGGGPPVVRIYGWESPSITIGYHQRPDRAIDLSHLGQTPLARRITGGRALLHDNSELTYAVAGDFIRYPVLGGSLSETYRLISEAIIRFYSIQGWTATMEHRRVEEAVVTRVGDDDVV